MPDRDLSDRCDDDSDDMKLAALNALIHMDAERARPILQKVLARRDAGSACLRQKAVFLVAQGGGDGVERILVETARTDPDPEVREQAVFWLSQVEGDAAVAALDSILRSSKDSRVREKALFALSQHDSPKSQQALRTFAERTDVSGDLREKAIFWIGQSGGADNAAYLRGLFGRLKGEELRNKVLFSISQMGGAENDRWLLSVARDRTQPLEIRKQALFWAGQAGASMADLGALYNTLDDPAMREQLIFVYSQRDEPAAVDKLLEIARQRSQSGDAQEGALLARPERRPPGGEGARRDHRPALGENHANPADRGRRPAAAAGVAPGAVPRRSGSGAPGDGTVRLSFAARPGVCGHANGISIIRSTTRTTTG